MTLTRRTPLKRTPMTRGRTRVTPVNRKRRGKEWLRAYGSPERVAFVASLPCIVSDLRCVGAIENMHVRGDGAGRKADARHVVPCCAAHHRESHTIGIRTFASVYRLDLAAEAARVEQLWNTLNPDTRTNG